MNMRRKNAIKVICIVRVLSLRALCLRSRCQHCLVLAPMMV